MGKAPRTQIPERAPAARYDRLETLLKNLPGMAYRCLNLKNWPMDFVSEGCFELCGYHREEIESQSVLWGEFTHPDMVDEVHRIVCEAANKARPFEVEYRIISRAGEEKWVWERGRVVDISDEGIAVLEGFITDITDRKLAEAALIRAEAYAQAIVESAVDAIVTVDDQGNIESFNQAACTMFGYVSSEVRGMSCRDLFTVNSCPRFEREFARLHGPGRLAVSGVELDGHHKNHSEFPIALSMQQILEVEEKCHVILIRDLTKQRKAEKEVRDQRDMLAHVDRLNTLGEMAAGIAHEINQPLTAISMYAQSSLRFYNKNPTNPARLEEALRKLSQQARRAGAVLERMQELTQPRESRQESISSGQLLRDVHNLAEVEAQIRNFVIVLRLEENLPKVQCDPIQIQQVILNLLRNGMESMRSAECGPGSEIILCGGMERNQVEISIIDCGTGISDALGKRLYQPFASTKESGMGLGLSISRSIVDAHGGHLAYYNNDHAGATFHFKLALAR